MPHADLNHAEPPAVRTENTQSSTGALARSARPPRALAPDLARGMMLLLIVLANIPWFLHGRESGVTVGHPFGATGLDRLVQGGMLVLVDMRALPMFALLFGYGMVQFARAQEVRGVPLRRLRAMLARRHVALLVLGALHAALLFFGDVLGTYGLLGLVLVALLLLRRTRTIKIVRGVLVGLLALYAILMVLLGTAAWRYPDAEVVMPVSTDVNGMESYLASILPRLSEWAFITGYSIVALSVPAAILTGWIWAREGVLDRPAEHLGRLRRTAVLGLLVGWAGGVPLMLTHLGAWFTPELGWMFQGLQMITGLAAGMGYAALFGLLAARVGRRGTSSSPGPGVRAVGAVGRRSLSAYLFQSVAMAPLLAAWGLGLGAHLGSAAAAGIAVLIWLVSVLLCSLLERSGRRGPAEVVLRRVTYGRPASSSPTVTDSIPKASPTAP